MRADDRGVIDLPIKIAVGLLIIAALSPVVIGMADSAMESMSSAGAEAEARRLAEAVTRAYYTCGDGDTLSVTLALGQGESLSLGGTDGRGYAVIVMVDGEEASRVFLDLPVLNEAEISGDVKVTVERVISDGADGVRIVT